MASKNHVLFDLFRPCSRASSATPLLLVSPSRIFALFKKHFFCCSLRSLESEELVDGIESLGGRCCHPAFPYRYFTTVICPLRAPSAGAQGVKHAAALRQLLPKASFPSPKPKDDTDL